MRIYEVPVEIAKDTYDTARFETIEEAHLFAKLIESEVWESVKTGRDTWSIFKVEDAWIPRRIACERLTELVLQHEEKETRLTTVFVVNEPSPIEVMMQ